MDAKQAQLLSRVALRLGRCFLLALAAAWALTWTSGSVLLNIPLVFATAFIARHVLSPKPPPPPSDASRSGRRRRTYVTPSETSHATAAAAAALAAAVLPSRHSHRWRDNVRSKVVEHAWETFCGSIVQQFIYETWYMHLSPDTEFPAEIRRLLNHAFGQGAARARGVDVRATMEDLCELVMEQLELYRDTREAVMADRVAAAALTGPDPAARERALRERMAADGNLHPALLQPEGDYKMLRSVSEGMVKLLLDPADHSRVAVKAVTRELLAGCVLRPLMMFATPYHVNKGMYRLLAGPRGSRVRGLPQGAAPELDAAKARAMRGHWEFEQRIVKTVEAEQTPAPKAMPRAASTYHLRQQQQQQSVQPEPRSRSFDGPRLSSTCPAESTAKPSTSGPPDAQPARFWSETQQATAGAAPPPPERQQPRSRLAGLSASQSSAPDSPSQPFPPPQQRDAASSSFSTDAATTSTSSMAVLRPTPFEQPSFSSAPPVMTTAAEPAATATGASSATSLGERGHLLAPCASSAVTEVHSAAHDVAHPSPAASLSGFMGRPRARVVAADLDSSGAKDVVVYKVRVGDDGTDREWTVSRRYRHFEVLHRQLRAAVGYHSKLPPKRIFIHTQNEDFVEDRRRALDAYLRDVLASPGLARSGDVWEFLRVGSERFEIPGAGGGSTSDGGGMAKKPTTVKRGLSRAVLAATQSVGRGVMDTAVDVTRGVTSAVMQEARSIRSVATGHHHHRRSASVPEDLQDFDPAEGEPGGGAAGAGPTPARSARRPDPLTRAGTGLLRTATASARKVRNVLISSGQHSGDREGSEEEGGGVELPTRELNFAEFGGAERRQSRQGSGSEAAGPSRSASPSKRSIRGLPRKPSRPPRGSSPVKLRRGLSSSLSSGLNLAERSAAFTPGFQPPPVAAWDAPAGDPAAPVIEVDAFGASSPLTPLGGPTPAATPPPAGGGGPPGPGLPDLDACSGISAPLYELVDCIFQLQTRGFFRRQVYSVARQVLSMAIGDAIDVHLQAQLGMVRQESTLARVIQLIQTSLWPGGVWFQHTPQFKEAHPPPPPPSLGQQNQPQQQPGMQPERYLEPSGPAPLDEDELREAVGELLLRRAPTALVRLVGKGPYCEGVQDLYEMMQSSTFMRQVGYGVLEIAVLHLCPELKPLFHHLAHGGLE